MTRLKIALMAGGDSPEREIALQSAAQIEAAIRKYANGLVDEVLKYGYTGLDLDYEPGLGSYHNGNIVMNQSQQGDIYAGTSPSQRTTWFVDECSKRLGPKIGNRTENSSLGLGRRCAFGNGGEQPYCVGIGKG